MGRVNKAHTATVNRIIRRYAGASAWDINVDVRTADAIIEVETEATIQRGVRRLKTFEGPVYLAVTNREALPEALRVTNGSHVGVMDPQGNIVRPAKALTGAG